MIRFLIFSCCIWLAQSVYFDTFKGSPISQQAYEAHQRTNTTYWCTADIKLPCSPHEWRRIDGSCNNLQMPSRNSPHSPTIRLLPAYYQNGDDSRPAASGEPLPLPRFVRTTVMPQGKVPDKVLSFLSVHFGLYFAADTTTLHDTINYMFSKACCEGKKSGDRECIDNKIPDDDPVRRFSSVKCTNLTRPFTFQNRGCAPQGTVPNRIVSTSPAFDLSNLYGPSDAAINAVRLQRGGLLKYEVEDGRIWPPSTSIAEGMCQLNVLPRETRCHSVPTTNSLLGINLMTIWFWRLHNLIASHLSQVNPCWDDERLFFTARDINIAIYLQIKYYEFWPLFIGHDNLLRSGVISPNPGFRDLYNDKTVPKVSLEFLQSMRWFHTVQEGTLKMYDLDGNYLKQFPIVNMTYRTGYLAVDNNIDYITQGVFRQRSGKIDYQVDPDIAELGLGPFQKATDLTTNDLHKNRLFGLAPYIEYRKLCSGKTYRRFEDLIDTIDEERMELLKDVYQNIADIDLLAGMWSERPMDGGLVPPTLACLAVEQTLRNVVSDRHWYERADRPHAFTLPQLLEIRKANIASMMCRVGDKVTRIQPRAFLRPGPGNEIRSCADLPRVDFKLWKDPTCDVQNVQIPINTFSYRS